jgi:hypothetical protein
LASAASSSGWRISSICGPIPCGGARCSTACFIPAVATFGKFALGFWLALLLNNHFPLKSLLRAIVLLPWIVPTVLSALAFWWIYDPQFSIISYLLVDVLHIRTTNIDFPRHALAGALLADRGQHLARHSLRGDLAAGGPADHLALAL